MTDDHNERMLCSANTVLDGYMSDPPDQNHHKIKAVELHQVVIIE